METKDPHLIKTPIDDKKVTTNDIDNKSHVDTVAGRNNEAEKNMADKSSIVDKHTIVNKGTVTLDEDIVDSEHVNDNDNPARQPDRRDQQGGTPFDDNINEDTVRLTDKPQSDEINELNRYANVENAQTRVLPVNDKKPTQ